MQHALPSAEYPLVSVIIPCYNYGHFLAEAIESIRQQAYPAKEIIVVDDGSTDTTREVAARYAEVIYIYQQNQGLSAARNTGTQQSRGSYLVFLDADDWLLPDALAINVSYLQQYPKAAFVAGAHTCVYTTGAPPEQKVAIITDNPYLTLLSRGNYIAMIAAVMFTRWSLQQVAYDTSLANCEDYDIYLQLTRRYPIAQHDKQLAAYRIHASAMSAELSPMLSGALKVLNRQRAYLREPAEIEAYYRGVHFWNTYYTGGNDFKFDPGTLPGISETIDFFRTHAPHDTTNKTLRYVLFHIPYTTARPLLRPLKYMAKDFKDYIATVGQRGRRWLRPADQSDIPGVGQVAAGDFERLTPFNNNFGYERGGPIDRYYIENFLQKETASIKGRVLEIGDNAYTRQFGGAQVSQSDILHIDENNPQATFVGDLSDAPHIPDNTFDCLILTQTLQFIYDFRGALHTCYRILKPGGTLLLTVPGITPLDQGEWRDIWYWSFTDKALRRLGTDTFPGGSSFEISSFGNVRVATAYLYGMGLPEIDQASLDYYDPQFQVINAVKAVKHAALA
jgi:glycosyltransferase involved in cell wall biosynthesis